MDLLLVGYSETSPSSELATEAIEKDLTDMAELLFFPLMGILDKLEDTRPSVKLVITQ